MHISLDTIVTIISIITGLGAPLWYGFQRFMNSFDEIGKKLEAMAGRVTELEKQYAVTESKLVDARLAKQDLDEMRRQLVMVESKLQAAFRIIDQINPMERRR